MYIPEHVNRVVVTGPECTFSIGQVELYMRLWGTPLKCPARGKNVQKIQKGHFVNCYYSKPGCNCHEQIHTAVEFEEGCYYHSNHNV